MKRTAAEYAELSQLLDEALDLEAAVRSAATVAEAAGRQSGLPDERIRFDSRGR
jgi:hypothetical protein